MRTSDTVLGVSNTSAEATAATFQLTRWRYPLPTDFTEVIGEQVIYSKGDNQSYNLRLVQPQEVRSRHTVNFRTGDTCIYAVEAGNKGVDSSDWYLTFWPIADATAAFIARYRAHPLDLLDATDLTADGTVVQIPAVHAETLKAAIQAATEEFYSAQPGLHSARYVERLAASIKFDRHTPGATPGTDIPGVDPRRYALLYQTPIYQ